MPRCLSLAAVLLAACGAAAQDAQEPEHRPVRPKGRFFTQEQLQQALRSAKESGTPIPKSSEPPQAPPPEQMKALLDFAKQNPELTKSLVDAARELMRENPDLLKGDREEAAKKIAEQMAKQSNLGDLLKQLDQKPPPSNVKRKPTEKTDPNGRRTRKPSAPKNPEQQRDGREEERRPQEESQGEPRPRGEEREGAETPKPAPNVLEDLQGGNPDFVKSLLEQVQKATGRTGRPPTERQIDEAIQKAAEQAKEDPAAAPWLNQPQTQKKIWSPQLREEIRKQAEKSPKVKRPQPDATREAPRQPVPDESPEKMLTERRPANDPDAGPEQPFRQRPPPPESYQKPPLEKRRGLKTPPDTPQEREMARRADKARKQVNREMAEKGARPGDRDPAPPPESQPESRPQDETPNPASQLAEMLKKNPGLVDSLVKSAGAQDGAAGTDAKETMKGLADAFKGTELEKQFRDMAKEFNKDGALNDLLKQRDEGRRFGGAPPRNARRDEAGASPKSAQEEATKAFKALAGEDFNAGKLGESMKSFGEALRKQTAGNERRAAAPQPGGGGDSPIDDGLGEGWLGALGRGASKVGEWGAKASQSLAQKVAPDESPRASPPSFAELKSLTLPSAEAGGRALLIAAIVAATAAIGWMLLRKAAPQLAGGPLFVKLPKLSLAGLPPREQAALLFERAALERLGEPARPKNHVALAQKLCEGTPDSARLAEVYEAARYTPPTEPFQPDQVGVVREIIARHGPPPKSVDGGK